MLLGSLLALTVLISVAPAQPQSTKLAPSVEMPPRNIIRVNANLVLVPVSVTDADGTIIQNLQIKDFAIDEDGEPVAISKLEEPGQTPLDLALLIDVSGSVNARFDFEKAAATSFLEKILRPEDRASIIAIGPIPYELLPQTLGSLVPIQALSQLEPTRGATAFFASVVMAAHQLDKSGGRTDARRVIVAISDGEDNNSENCSLADALREIQRADCIFYSINPSAASLPLNEVSRKGQEGMRSLAEETGGIAFVPEMSSDLSPIFGRIAAEIQAQYLLGYYSTNAKANGDFHQIAVRVPSKPSLRIRARQGYYARRG
jgi:Ca-activated chloride channel homolog